MRKVEHIGIAVKDLKKSCDLYEKLLGVSFYKKEMVTSEQVDTAFFKVGDQKIELLAATSVDSTIAAFLNKNGEGIHHLAFSVDNILLEMERLKSEGFILLNESPKIGADQKLVCFIHPKTAGGVLVELCQDITPI
jgi:methylmalonyl-CoA/ethylmalonyl-CoA epimerase